MNLDAIEKLCKNKTPSEILQLAVDYQYGTCEITKNVETAAKLYLKAYKSGNMLATLFLGLIFEQGIGVSVDFDKARYYYELGINNDITQCYTRLGIMYLEGEGVKQDYKKALDYFNKGKDLGDSSEACLWLGYMYENGLGVKQNNKFAIKFYEVAAFGGNVNAQFQLGYMFEFGICTKTDLYQARYYYKKSLQSSETREKTIPRLNAVEKIIADNIYEKYKDREITIKEYCELHDKSIGEKEIKDFVEITKTNADEVFNKMYQALNKYKISQFYIEGILRDVDAWFRLYKNPEETIRKFTTIQGDVLSSFLYKYLVSD